MNECNPRATFKPTNYKWQLELERPQPTPKHLNDYKLTTLSQSQETVYYRERLLIIDRLKEQYFIYYMLFQQIWKPANMTKRLYRLLLYSDDFTDD